jgi:hypothetical protein
MKIKKQRKEVKAALKEAETKAAAKQKEAEGKQASCKPCCG